MRIDLGFGKGGPNIKPDQRKHPENPSQKGISLTKKLKMHFEKNLNYL